MSRPPALAVFIEALRDAVTMRVSAGDAAVAAERIFVALETPGPIDAHHVPSAVPALCHLEPALRAAADRDRGLADVTDAIGRLHPILSWQQRPGAARHGDDFRDGHCNTSIVGAQGLECRYDVIVGASLMAPRLNYPDHKHAPEELYLVLSEGDWYHESRGWYTPGTGGLVYHCPWVTHAMRSGDDPLLAVWCLWNAH